MHFHSFTTSQTADNMAALAEEDIDAWIRNESTPLLGNRDIERTFTFDFGELRAITDLYTVDLNDSNPYGVGQTLIDAHNTWTELGIYQEPRMNHAYGVWLIYILENKTPDKKQSIMNTIDGCREITLEAISQ